MSAELEFIPIDELEGDPKRDPQRSPKGVLSPMGLTLVDGDGYPGACWHPLPRSALICPRERPKLVGARSWPRGSSHSSSLRARRGDEGQRQLVVCRETQQLSGRYLVCMDAYSIYRLGIGYLGMFLAKHTIDSNGCCVCTQRQRRVEDGDALTHCSEL